MTARQRLALHDAAPLYDGLSVRLRNPTMDGTEASLQRSVRDRLRPSYPAPIGPSVVASRLDASPRRWSAFRRRTSLLRIRESPGP